MKKLKKKRSFKESKWATNSSDAAIDLHANAMVETQPLKDGQTLPLVVKPRVTGVLLQTWLRENWAWLEARLHRHGAVLFRGFDLPTADDFIQLVEHMPLTLIDYMESSTPRQELKKKFYTATEFPPEETIALHNELSTAETFPMKVFFYCETPPAEGGETPIADVRNVYERIDPTIRNEFETKGWSLIRNYGDGFGLDWRESFHTENKADVEDYCLRNRMTWEWKSGDRLRTKQVRPAVIDHPKTGEHCWFNHMAFWHIANLRDDIRNMFETSFASEDLPYHTYFGDGTPIPDAYANHIRDTYIAEKQSFPWQNGDVMVLDNVLAAHGRHPYQGRRKVLVTMGEAYTRKDIVDYATVTI